MSTAFGDKCNYQLRKFTLAVHVISYKSTAIKGKTGINFIVSPYPEIQYYNTSLEEH